MSINSVAITGNLTRDPELRSTSGGYDRLSFCVAVNMRRRNQSTGEWEDVPNFIDCVVFGNRAAALAKIMRKGMKVAVLGKLRQSRWDAGGEMRSRINVIADDVDVMQRRASSAQQADDEALSAMDAMSGGDAVQVYDRDIPF